jgi:hypothetical protein
MSAEPSSTPFEYAPARPQRRRWVRRSLAVVLLLLLASSYWWAPAVWRRVQLAYWYEKCLNHSPPAGTVVQRLRGGAIKPPVGPGYVPDAWREFYSEISPPGFKSKGTAFLGRRHTPDGREVLVAVDLAPPSPGASGTPADWMEFQVRVFVANDLSAAPRQLWQTTGMLNVPPASIELRAGQPDPNDPTHFTIPYVLDELNSTGTIEGWVRNDGVTLDRGSTYSPSPRPPASPG